MLRLDDKNVVHDAKELSAATGGASMESFMDELARAADTDPEAFRLKHLADSRAEDVIKLAAGKFGRDGFQRGTSPGRGLAFARYKNLAAYAAVDNGEAVNPDGIRNQIEGGIVQSARWTSSEEVISDRTRITSRDWGGYPILRFPQVPQRVDVFIVPRPGQPFLATDEAARGPAAAMIANAVADATGARLRQLPLSRERVRAALAT